MMWRAALLAALLALPAPTLAVQPDEILPDAAMEARARDISAGLRCLVCRNESIDESNADLARDMRLLVRERLVEGDSNDQVVAFIVERYGEYVLLRPTRDGANLILWLSAPFLALLGLGAALVYLRGREKAPETSATPLDADEAKRLQDLLKE
jgi:cytochrome c-type biogenesis protein CcmH